MAYSKIAISKAKDMWLTQGLKVDAIVTELNAQGYKVSCRTIARWIKTNKWENTLSGSATANTYITLFNNFLERINTALSEGTIKDAKEVDALLKTQIMLEKLMPEQMLLGNMYLFLEDISQYIVNITRDETVLTWWQDNLEAIGDHLRHKYVGKK